LKLVRTVNICAMLVALVLQGSNSIETIRQLDRAVNR